MDASTGPESPPAPQRESRRELLLMLGGFAAFIVVSFVIIMAMNPSNRVRWRSLFVPSPRTASQPLALVLVHTNDTWGYTEPCG